MRNSFTKFGIWFWLVLSLIMIFPQNALSEEGKTFDAKRRAFCRTMLSHAKDAYSRGDYEKAGYYLQQAVQADPTRMAKSWFKHQGIVGGKESAPEEITPQPPEVPTLPEKPHEESEVVMGDDEGC